MLRFSKTGLRSLERDDLRQLLAWRNNPDMNKYYREWRQLNMCDQEAWFNAVCCGNRNYCMFGIVSLVAETQNDLIGVCGLTNINWITRSAEISLYIGYRDLYIDNVHAPQALLIMEDYAFNTLDMERCWAEIYVFDEPKRRLFEDFKMIREAELRNATFYKGKYYNSLIYSHLKNEFDFDALARQFG